MDRGNNTLSHVFVTADEYILSLSVICLVQSVYFFGILSDLFAHYQ
jgi:hypothetical protein